MPDLSFLCIFREDALVKTENRLLTPDPREQLGKQRLIVKSICDWSLR